MSVKTLIKDWLPPALLRYLLPWFGLTIRYRGCYASHAEAAARSTGYDAGEILAKVEQATGAVLAGTAVAERDGVLLEQRQAPYPVIAELLFVATQAGGRLRVCDFGGSLGSVYRACGDYLAGCSEVRWGVVEQPMFVSAGQQRFANEQLRFYASLDACAVDIAPQVLLLSSVLQYLAEPLAFLQQVNAGNWSSIIIDRTPFVTAGPSVVTVQSVPARWVKSSYPSWLLAAEEIKRALPDFAVVGEFPALDGRIGSGRLCADFRGMILRRKSRPAS